MRKVDLKFFEFDCGLTLSILLMHPDGTIFHRYGSRDGSGPMSWMSMNGFLDLLAETTKEHRAYQKRRSAGREATKPFTVNDLKTFQRDDRRKRINCVHCHTIDDYRQFEHEENGT